jgi:hypothetical protein
VIAAQAISLPLALDPGPMGLRFGRSDHLQLLASTKLKESEDREKRKWRTHAEATMM